MDYEETVKYLFNSAPVFEQVGSSAYKEGLSNSLDLDNHFGHPHHKFKSIHVAGTNGKGSCSHTLAAILQSEGYKVGLYTSPHLVDFRERIRVNGECISKEYVIDFVEKERSFFEPLHPSFFELTTALAFKYFAEQDIDIAVIEVGLGGRLDCTNIITPVLSVITNISFDHTQFLGNTLAKIAGEKAGIIKENIPVVIGEYTDETYPVFISKAKETNSHIVFAQDDKEIMKLIHMPNGHIEYTTKHFGVIEGELGGMYQKKNTNTVLCAIKELINFGIIKNTISVRKGFNKVVELTGLEGRWQKFYSNPTCICDTGHNVGGWQYISEQLKSQKCRNLRIVFGMVDDKDINAVMDMLPKDAIYYFTRPSSKRAFLESSVYNLGINKGLKGNCFHSVDIAFNCALSDSNEDDFIFVGGSSYIVADLLSFIKSK